MAPLRRNTLSSGVVDDAVAPITACLDASQHVIASSSFQTHSIPMLAIVAAAGPVPIYFPDTWREASCSQKTPTTAAA